MQSHLFACVYRILPHGNLLHVEDAYVYDIIHAESLADECRERAFEDTHFLVSVLDTFTNKVIHTYSTNEWEKSDEDTSKL